MSGIAPSSPPGSSGLQIPSVANILPLLTESIAHRTELAAIELDEARTHALGSSLLAGATCLLLLLAGFALTLLIAALVWESPYRGWWLMGLCAAYLAVVGTIFWRLRKRLLTWRPLVETQTQVRLDFQCLNTLLKSFGR